MIVHQRTDEIASYIILSVKYTSLYGWMCNLYTLLPWLIPSFGFPRSRSDLWTSYAFRNWAPKKNTEKITTTSLEKNIFQVLHCFGHFVVELFHLYIMYIYIYIVFLLQMLCWFLWCVGWCLGIVAEPAGGAMNGARDEGQLILRSYSWNVTSSVLRNHGRKIMLSDFILNFCCWSAAVPVPVFAVCRTFRRYQSHSPTLLPLSWRIMSITWKTFQELGYFANHPWPIDHGGQSLWTYNLHIHNYM